MAVRKRRLHDSSVSTVQPSGVHKGENKEQGDGVKEYDVAELRGSFWLTRIVFIRSLGFVYCKNYSNISYG